MLLALLLTGCAKPPEVQVVSPREGKLRQVFTEQAETRMVRTFPVNLPVAGRIGRIDLEPGDRVTQGQVLVSYDRFDLDARVEQARSQVAESQAGLAATAYAGMEEVEEAEAAAMIAQAEARWHAARSAVELAWRRHEQAGVDLKRTRKLFDEGAVPRKQMEDAQLRFREAELAWQGAKRDREAARATVDAARTRRQMVDRKLEQKSLQVAAAQARVQQSLTREAREVHELARGQVRSPIAGVVLQRLEQGPRDLAAGAPLLVLGRPGDLEVMSEVLTEDALRLQPGSVVELLPGGGRPELTAHVKKIEPAGFTKLSSLGVEQKRVRVLARLSPVPPWLGAGYRLQARFITGEKEKALLVDRFSVLQDPQGKSYVFKVVNGKLVRQDVELGLRGELEYEIVKGLTTADRIVKVPDPATTAGGEVTPVQ